MYRTRDEVGQWGKETEREQKLADRIIIRQREKDTNRHWNRKIDKNTPTCRGTKNMKI
jgi:hypothetical protein